MGAGFKPPEKGGREMMRTITSVVLAVALAVVSAGAVEGDSVGVPTVTPAGVGVVDEMAAGGGESVSRWGLYWYVDHSVGCSGASSSDESDTAVNCEEVGENDGLSSSMICLGAGAATAFTGPVAILFGLACLGVILA